MLGHMLKEPTYIQAHLVLPTHGQTLKNQKSLNFATARQKMNRKFDKILKDINEEL